MYRERDKEIFMCDRDTERQTHIYAHTHTHTQTHTRGQILAHPPPAKGGWGKVEPVKAVGLVFEDFEVCRAFLPLQRLGIFCVCLPFVQRNG